MVHLLSIKIMKTIGNQYIIKKTIDTSGATSTVYLVECIKTGKTYAAKVYDNYSDYFYNEVEILKKLSSSNNSNIIHLISWGEEYIVNDESDEKKQFIVMDYLPNKDLFTYIQSNEITENEAKSFFYKIVKAMKNCHDQGICHRDLKLGNILLDMKNEPVICDFGYGSLKVDDLDEFQGTYKYMAPEVLRQKKYNGIKADIFSLGVILFALVFKDFGFHEASFNSDLYKLVMKKKFNDYWKGIGNILGEEKVKNVSLDCKELIFSMWAYSPKERPTIEEILNHNWLKDI